MYGKACKKNLKGKTIFFNLVASYDRTVEPLLKNPLLKSPIV
jgi:hypothetical protein